MTMRVGIREITRQTSKMIHRAAAGETVLITEHDQPIAMLVPLPDTGDPAVDELIREGKLTPASNPGGIAALLAIRPATATHDGDTAEVVSELREDRM
ncbi:type II toxin-antitoxin system Phd/YefM family antitoxin [Candidatus Frankia alpina]|uniref:Type II toxin-antitoxin system prevent-host-death family antitoxin n=2 Tax=Frankiaceae TaxID=74712 RepID=A0A4S5ET88_9ACTN|nr:type II toxin-antitoxin system prevent-host-death family antitoxin [Candidatus Frankia alpina]THJ75765.1 type II toxin-antitoxin system prevent-host-death family antitoxin [Candidatus Frankia alpina]